MKNTTKYHHAFTNKENKHFVASLFLLLTITFLGIAFLYQAKPVTVNIQVDHVLQNNEVIIKPIFDEIFCENALEIKQSSEVFPSNYHINGDDADGIGIVWFSEERSSETFSIFEYPNVFFVKSTIFEGCGKTLNLKSAPDVLSEISSSFFDSYDCTDGTLYVNQKTNINNVENTIYFVEDSGNIILVKMLTHESYNNLNLPTSICSI